MPDPPTADNLSPAEQADALQKIQDAKIRENTTAMYVDDVRHSLLFRPGFNWNDTISAAPVAITLMGSLFVASTIPDATNITIIPPKDGFKTLMNFAGKNSLNACLIQCADEGMKAFTTAADCYDHISLKSGTLKGAVNQIITTLGDPESAQRTLKPSIQRLSDIAKACEAEAVMMRDAVQHWLDMVCEVHICVVQTSQNTAEKQAANQIHLAVAEARLSGAEEAKKLAADTVDTLRDSLKQTTSAYIKAADEFPSGWELVAQEFVSDMSQAYTNAFNLAVPALIENFSITAKLKAGVNIFKGDNGGATGGSLGDKPAPVDHSQVPTATVAPNPTPSAVPLFPNDPAYGVISVVRGYVMSVSSFVTGGPDHGVDWDTLQSTDPAKTNTGLGVWVSLLDDARKNFKPSANPPSTTLVSVFDNVKQVTDPIQAVLEKRKAINDKEGLPKADSPDVKAWQLAIKKAVVMAVQLDTDAANLTSPHPAPFINRPETTSKPVDQRGGFRKQIIDAATTKMTTAAKAMETSSANFTEASRQLVDVQIKIGEIQGQLADLEISKMNLETIRAVLVKCIEILVKLKTQVNRLVGFFSAVATLVQHVVDDHVGPFVEYLEASVRPGFKEVSLLNFSLTDVQRQLIFNFSLTVRAYADLFRDIAVMYSDVDKGFIRPGLDMVNNLQAEYNATLDAAEKEKILNQRWAAVVKYNKGAVDGVVKLVSEKQPAISASLGSNAEAAAKSLDFLPVRPAPHVAQAVDASAKASKDAAEKGIKESSKLITRAFSSTQSLVDDSA